MITETGYVDESDSRDSLLTGRAVTDPKRLVEHSFRVDLAQLRNLRWSRWGRPLAGRMTISTPDSQVVVTRFLESGGHDAGLRIQHQIRDGQPAFDAQWFDLTPTEPHLGGTRWWIVCDGLGERKCGQRVRTLFRPRGARFFSCRECHRLTYRCRQQNRLWRWEKVDRPLKLQDRLIADLSSRSPRRQFRALWKLDPDFRRQAVAELERSGEVG